jgi:hypothetical protein
MTRTHRIARAATRLAWGAALAVWLVIPAPASSEDGPSVPTDERGEPLFVTSCEGGTVEDIPTGAVVLGPSPLYPPELSARIAEATLLTTIELRSVEDLAELEVPPNTPWVQTLAEELAAGEGPIEIQDLRKDPWPEVQREMAEIFDRYYDWCLRPLPNGDFERDLLAKSWPPWLT